MNGRRFAVLALAVAACSTQPSVGSRFNGPTTLVSFRGVTRKDASNMRTYVAVASSRGDEVRIVDPADLQPVVSPGSVFPLSVPTAPRPLLLAAAPLGDAAQDLADVLVVASAGAVGLDGSRPALQLVETWDQKTAARPGGVGANLVAQDVPLTGLAAGSDLLCMVGMAGRTPGTARILVGASKGQLAVVEFTRATDGSGAVVPGTVTVLQLGFDPLDMAVDPNGATVYIATREPIATDSSLGPTLLDVFGVAALGDATTDILTATPKALAGGPRNPDPPASGNGTIGAPTVAVAVAPASVLERTINSADTSSADRLSTPTSFVYAALDPASCGSSKHIGCGVVAVVPGSTLSEAGGNLAPDPTAAALAGGALVADGGPGMLIDTVVRTPAPQAYRAPIPVPGVPLHIAIASPPIQGTQRVTNDSNNPGVPLLTIAPGTGNRNTSAVATVSSSDGHVYWLDLSRWGPASDTAETGGVFVTGVTAAATVDTTTTYQLGLWQDADNLPFGSTVAAPAVVVDAPGMAGAIDVWPGFTDGDTWSLTYQGVLPALSSRPGLLVTEGTTVYAALQTSAGVVTTPIADPALGVHDATTVPGTPGDIVVLPGCEVSVAAVKAATVPPFTASGVAFPGGALQLDASAIACPGVPAAAASTATTVTVRASGLVFASLKLGYLGRPAIARTTDRTENVFSVAWTGTADVSTPSVNPPRLQQERRAIERKARRRFYPSDGPCPISTNAGTEGALASGCYGTGRKRLKDPVAPGPVIRFRVGVVGPPLAVDAVPVLPRDATIVFTTQTGLSQVFRRPVLGGAGPGNVLAFDYTKPDPTGNPKPPQFSGHQNDAITFFVPYLDDQVVTFSTVQNAAEVTSIR